MSRILKITPRFRYTPIPTKPIRGYIEESGLCYTEVTCNGGSMTADWSWKTVGSSREYEHYSSTGPGCSSLKDMAIRVAILNAFNITPEALAEVPWELAKQLWNKMVASELDSLQTWKAFASAYPHEATIKTKEQLIRKPRMDLANYITHLTSQSFHWITFLSLESITCLRSELVQLSKLSNLGALTIDPGFNGNYVGLDDNVIRSWMRAVNESNAFSVLRVLNFSLQKQITGVAFDYLAQFPCLAIINFASCGIGLEQESAAVRCGWKYKTDEEFRALLLDAGITRPGWNSIADACFRQSEGFSKSRVTDKSTEAITSLPVLHFSLGDSSQHITYDMPRRHRIKSFQRWTPCPDALEAPKESKRLLTDAPESSRPTRKRHTIRASKQQDLGDLLTGFGS